MTRPQLRSTLPEWHRLQQLAAAMRSRHLREFAPDADRARALGFRAGPLFMDLSRQRLDRATLAALLDLAQAVGLPDAAAALMRGETVNRTEGRPALHTALRLPRNLELRVDGQDILPAVHDTLDRMAAIVERLHAGQWPGFSGRPVTDVVNIGVGGSDHGPLMAVKALREFAPAAAHGLRTHFVSSIDGTQLSALLETLDRETTLFLISSKSFGTPDTLANANLFRQWMLDACPDPARVLERHFIGISANPAGMAAWGIPPENRLLLWDWVGGRFSMWSAIGLPIAIRLGMDGFREMLAGAAFMDRHFLEAEPAANLPMLLGLTGVWNATFLGIGAHAVLPYDGRLNHLPTYLSQLEMESNGKSVNQDGDPLDFPTCPVLWGEVGSNAQHTFFQLLHQGTHDVSCDFITPVQRYRHSDDPHHPALQAQHRLSVANCLAQARVLMLGDDCLDRHDHLPAWRRYRGNQSSTLLLLDELTPYSLGALVALYEHKVYSMAVLWDINPFDQWGVELGKVIAEGMNTALKGRPADGLDAPTRHSLQTIDRMNRRPFSGH